MNAATHCNECGRVLSDNRYDISPFTSARCNNKAWCKDCYEHISLLDRARAFQRRRGLDDLNPSLVREEED